LERYGVEYYLNSTDVKIKGKETSLQKYGTEHPSQSLVVKNKVNETCLGKYGTEHYFQSDDKKQKSKETCLKKYGTEYATQNLEIMEKAQKNAHKYKEYKMPSGIIKKVQGYESFALDELVKNYTEYQLKTDRKDVPRVEYMMGENKHFYFPDIYIPHENKIIEVKSTWTAEKKKDNIFLKQNAGKQLGYNYEIWVYNRKYEKI
jgi:hypothetical protein